MRILLLPNEATTKLYAINCICPRFDSFIQYEWNFDFGYICGYYINKYSLTNFFAFNEYKKIITLPTVIKLHFI